MNVESIIEDYNKLTKSFDGKTALEILKISELRDISLQLSMLVDKEV